MSSALPPEIAVEAIRDNVTYSLPARRLGKLRWVGLFLVAFGVLFISGPISMELHNLRKIFGGKADVGTGFFSIFMVPFILAGLMPLGMGCLVMFGRCRVEWRDQQLRVVEHAGPIRWVRRLS